QMIFEDRRRALRLLDGRQLEVGLLLRLLDAALHVADRFGVFVDLDAIIRPEIALEARQLRRDRIENALVLPQARFARLAIGAAAVAEEALEHDAWIPFHRQRLRRAAPRQRVRVDATESAGARTGVRGRDD